MSHYYHLNVYVVCLFHLRCCNFTLRAQLYRDRSELVGVDGDSYSEVSAGASVIAEVHTAASSAGFRQCLSDHKLSVKPEKHPEPGDMGDKELMWALKNGDLDEVKTLLVKAEDVNRTLEGGRKPLHYAVDCGQTEMLEFLLSKGADVNAPDKHGITPLLSATYEGHVTCVKILLEKGADKNRKGPDGLSAFEAAENEAIRDLLK